MPFVDGDDLHPASNVEKMSRGEALDDTDRLPWLQCIRQKAVELTHPVHKQRASDRQRSSRDEPLAGEQAVREMAAVLETSEQSGGQMEGQGVADDGKARSTESGEASLARACVIACSALKKSYRDLLRGPPGSTDLRTILIYLRIPPDELRRRMHERKGHFMKESMLQSQLATLEEPEGEVDTVVVDDGPPTEQVGYTRDRLESMMHGTM